ncbi:MAG TPA: zinc-binding dehydrogenase [Candidatus Nanopelagicales bacterium]|nr:zinc-binding dehydrogenase [Candidatus Nanopelagicales bacterium]
MTTDIRAVLITPDAPGRLTLGRAPRPTCDRNETLMRVRALSFNRGELRRAQGAPAGGRIGWDVAGLVEQQAADGSGPPAGARVVGFIPDCNGWAELAAVPSSYLAEIPAGVSDESAAALPVAGLTALYGLERGSRLLGQRVLVTGASGGVGTFAVQIARLMGATVIAQIRRPEHEKLLRKAGADEIVIDETGETLAARGPYRMILDGVGGSVLARTAPKLSTGGTAVVYGVTAQTSTELSLGPLLGSGNASVQGFNLYHEARSEPPSGGLARLLSLVRAGELDPFVSHTAPWTDIGEAAAAFLARKHPGKVVLTVDS